VLSTIATIYDPLGLIGPVIVIATILMQKLWQHKLEWGDLFPTQLNKEWGNYSKELNDIENIKIPRRIIGVDNNNEVTGSATRRFEHRYGACIYLKATDGHVNCTTRLVIERSTIKSSIVSPIRAVCCCCINTD